MALTLLGTVVLLGTNGASADTMDTLVDYSTGASNGTWSLWARTTTDASICDPGTPHWDAANHNYVIEATFSPNCGYIYYQMTGLPHALDGNTVLHATVDTTVTTGMGADASVEIGYGINYPGFGQTGRVARPYAYEVALGGPQTIGGDISSTLATDRDSMASDYALGESSDFLATTPGPALYLFNTSFWGATRRALSVRVTIDNVHVERVGSTLGPTYLAAASSATSAYVNRVTPVLSALDGQIQSTVASVAALQLGGQPLLQSQIAAEANQAAASHAAILASAQARAGTLKVPTGAEYEQDVVNRDVLTGLLTTGSFAVLSGPTLAYYGWNSTGRKKLDDLSVSAPGTPQQVGSTTMALGEAEPVSVVLQNLFGQSVTVDQVAVGTLSNQFGEIFPAAGIDKRIVKNWYTGSSKAVQVSPSDTRVRVPELLLKDDDLVRTDEATRANSLRIETQGTQRYQDISSPTAQMPNGAVVADSVTLQPFTVGAFHARQLWLTIDSRAPTTRPGDYAGTISVSYHVAGDASLRTLQIPFAFTIAPVQLDASGLMYSLYYRGTIGSTSTLTSDTKSQQQYVADMQNMLAHGVAHPTQYLNWGDVPLALAALKNHIQLREQAGLPCDRYFLLSSIATVGTDATAAYTNAQQLTTAVRQSSACPGAQLYMYGTDEAVGSALDAEHEALRRVHDAGVKTYVAGYNGTFGALGDVLDVLVASGTNSDDTERALWRQAGKDVYSYGNPQVGIPDPAVYRTNYGLFLWQHDYTGAMNYAYQHAFPGSDGAAGGDLAGCATSTTGYCSLWNDFDSSQYYDHLFTYPTTTGAIDTVQWEGFREAVDDTRYLATLQARAQASSDVALAGAITGWLANLKAQAGIDPAAARAQMQDYLHQLNRSPVFGAVAAQVTGSTISVSGQASDPEGYLGSVEVKFDTGAWTSLGSGSPWQKSFANVAPGAHTVYYRATDYWNAVTSGQIPATYQAVQTITVTTAAPTSVAYNGTFTVAATASSALPVTVSTSGGCSNSANTITITSGTTACTVNYDQSGSLAFLPAPRKSSTTSVSRIAQTITVTTPAPASAAYAATFTVAASANSGLSVAITVSGGCSISAATVTMTSASNNCKVFYNRAANSNYTAAPQKSSTTTATKAAQVITLTTPIPTSVVKGASFPATATANSGLTVSIAVSPSTACSITGGIVKAKAVGTCTVKFNQSGNTNYASAAQIIRTVTITLT
ncbi:MAG: hypothetical protein WCJ67_00385 [Thermoleophilia bacterium]